ncbi:hypothetical protein IAQ61_008921 [Plenodomus lingam]|uniref:Uncharacterized protein n=1 Tax=Leptosphaeria maculans (strain JN3 / isolate v23.1.3 / race Av1-4-5-6-7-8) TaxID=985895 RepID=E4ZPH3_LEPMJ|nr:hypothetical protein LEMA_P040990.1 [Plenodomus lingam JN3]KAH9864975.1 hypothetical protein IAQ61_008921 [Plenodomus lingam]CBX93198.1 hypothetical protein LEMA_P040990.1 [Plenodomus lingam JN3]
MQQSRASLEDLIRNAGVVPEQARQPCLPAPCQPIVSASEEDRMQARNILLERRAKNPEHKSVLKSMFKSSKEKEKAQEAALFSQDELDQALSSVIGAPTTGPGLVQAFLSLGAKVNIIETPEKKRKSNQPNTSLRRRSTVLQQAASVRRADSVNLLASSGADQITLNEGLKAALTANDQACIQELLRYGADLNHFPNALANAVRSKDQNHVRLLLRAPKSLRSEIVSSCLPAAVQQKSYPIVSLLIANGADPNFDSSSALNTSIGVQDYKMTVTLVSGPIPLTPPTLQRLLDTTMRLPTRPATLQYLQLLFCCGLPPNSIGLPHLLISTTRHDDTAGAKMMISYGVSTLAHDAQCLMLAIEHANWPLVETILETDISSSHASMAITVLPTNTPQGDRFRVIQALIQKGATGPPLGQWLTRAAEDGDAQLLELLLSAGAPMDLSAKGPLNHAVMRQDIPGLRMLLKSRPSPEALATAFPLLRHGYTPSARREVSMLLLEHGAQGPEVSQALVDAVMDDSSARDDVLITEFVQRGADVNFANGKALSLAVTQKDVALVRLVCSMKPRTVTTSLALPLSFDSNGARHSRTLEIIEILLVNGLEEAPAHEALRISIKGGPRNIDIIRRLIDASPKLITPAFEYTVALEDCNQKAPILEVLLKIGVTQEALDQALVSEVTNVISTKDTTATKLLLGQGASVSYNDGEALGIAVASGSSSLTTLLLSGNHQPSRSSVTKAFRALFSDQTVDSISKSEKSVITIAQDLLSRGVEPPAIDAALRSVLADDSRQNIDSLVDLLLQHNANVNVADGACFVFAAQKQDVATFEKLILHRPNFAIIVPALLRSKMSEEAIIFSIKSCFAHGCTSDELDNSRHGTDTPILVLAMYHHPRNESLINVLLAHGLNPDVSTPTVIASPATPSGSAESAPTLLWALAQPQKRISDAVITALLQAGASTRTASAVSETTALMLAARDGRHEVIQALLERGSDADARDGSNRSALLFVSGSVAGDATARILAPRALRNDGSLHEAARELDVNVAKVLVENGHDPNFPSRLHGGRNALGELCLNAQVETSAQRSKVRQMMRLLLDRGASPTFRARNEKAAVVLALDNAYSALPITEALLETETWQHLNDEKHMYRDPASGLWYSPLSYVDKLASPSRAPVKQQLLSLLRDKACEPKYYSETALQPVGATGIPAPIARLVDRQKEHELSLRHAKETHEHTRTLEETSHRDMLRRRREAQEAEQAAAAAAQQHWQALEQQKHEFEVQRVRDAERMKRAEKVAWHNLVMEQERDAAAKRQAYEERKAGAAMAAEAKMVEQRRSELEHRAGVERRMLKEKEDVYERNVARQKEVMKSADESAKLHARLRQERPAIEGAPHWGTVD